MPSSQPTAQAIKPTPQAVISADDILTFWFKETSPQQWFIKDTDFDNTIAERFKGLHACAAQAELWHWRDSAEGRLAEIIVLDQFSRNLYRGSAKAFAADAVALVLAQEAVRLSVDTNIPTEQRAFLYMPYMHSESAAVHEEAVRLFEKLGNKQSLDFEKQHQDIIDRFGRYPHRNAVIGRQSTAEELEFLKQHSGF